MRALYEGQGRYREPNAWQLGRLQWELLAWRCVVTIDGGPEGTSEWVLVVDADAYARQRVIDAAIAHAHERYSSGWEITAEVSPWPVLDGKLVPR